MHTLDHAVQSTEYDLPSMASMMRATKPPLDGPDLSVDALKTIAAAWMDDLHDYCRVTRWVERLDEERTTFNRVVRDFRQARPWLRKSLRDGEWLRYREPCNGTVLFSGWRRAPDGAEEVLFVGNMEGRDVEVVPRRHAPEGQRDSWTVARAAPALNPEGPDATVSLANSEAILLTRTSQE